jgi:DNA repair photolyase
LDITEVTTKTALVRSRIPGVEYVINPYTGCGHGCRYCYAVFMGKYSKMPGVHSTPTFRLSVPVLEDSTQSPIISATSSWSDGYRYG